MQQSAWKKALSHLFEIHIESAPSDLNPHLYVSLRKGRYQLCTANAIYSYADLYDNFYNAFTAVDFEKEQIKDVLILGFGLGSIPWMLEKNFSRNFHYTAIEADEAIIYLANKYTLDELSSSIQLICADAFAFVFQSEEQFDLICMDIFLDDIIPEHFKDIDYLEALKARLSPNGILMFNCLSVNAKDKELTKAFFENIFARVFPEATYLDVKSNWILLNRPL
ncbi:MAG: fused MFS/spermidine synthase [Saprospiraceae bacterium]|nr:fused MFS/spermidine synthase [Saprospiraceae bacterium]